MSRVRYADEAAPDIFGASRLWSPNSSTSSSPMRPSLAKDFQQLVTIRRMAEDLNMGIEVLGLPTVRGSGRACHEQPEQIPDDRPAPKCIEAE